MKSLRRAAPSAARERNFVCRAEGERTAWLSMSLPQALEGGADGRNCFFSRVSLPCAKCLSVPFPYRWHYFSLNPLWPFCRLLILLFKLWPEVGDFWMEIKCLVITIPWERQFYSHECSRELEDKVWPSFHKPKAKILYFYFFLKWNISFLGNLGKNLGYFYAGSMLAK